MNKHKALPLVVLVGTAVLGSAVQGQYVPPQASADSSAGLATAQTQGYAAGLAAAAPGYAPPPPAYYPGGYYGPYGGYYAPYVDPYGGYLNGVAAVTNANAQYQVTIQQARSAQAQADMARLDVRRRLQEEKMYEQSLVPDPEQVRLNEMRRSLERSRRNPPPTDIWSGVALNDLLQYAQAMLRQGLRGPDVPLDPDTLRQINVTTGTTQGSTGALTDGPLDWPLTLRGEGYTPDREKFDRLAGQLLKQAASQGVDPATVREARETLGRLEDRLRNAIADLTPDEYISSRRYLTQLREAVRTLEDPNAANYVTRKWAAHGNTVAELVEELTRSGLKFAPAVRGGQPAYTVLYSAMATYDDGLQRLARAAPAAQLTGQPSRAGGAGR